MTRGRPSSLSAPDVVILHGAHREIVDALSAILEAMGITAKPVLDLAAGGRRQEEKVNYYIRNSRIALVLLTFDPKDAPSRKARPNVYDEIARCRTLGKGRDTIVLQQQDKDRIAELPSNVAGQMVVLQFAAAQLHAVIPPLLRELKSRELPRRPEEDVRTVQAGGLLNRFLDKMDTIWEGEFDNAWPHIHRQDYEAESNFADTLDAFFQQYHKVFCALIRDKKRGDDLKVVCDAAYTEALNCAARAWEYVADSKMRTADKASHETKVPPQRRTQAMYDDASGELRNGRSASTPEVRIKHFRKAISLAKDYLDRV